MLGKLFRLLKDLIKLAFILDRRNFLFLIGQIILNFPLLIKEKKLDLVYRKMAGRNCVFRINGQDIRLDGKYFGYASEIYGRKVYFALPKFKLPRGGIIVDLGADGGVFTVLAALFNNKVIAVEANLSWFEDLKKNALFNNCQDKIIPTAGIVGPGTGWISGLKNFNILGWQSKEPPVLSLNRLLEDYNIEKVDFLKIDIEGSEFDLFCDNSSLWLPKIKLIAMEVHTQFGDIEEIKNILKDNNFEVQYVDLNKKIVSEIKGEAGYLFASRHTKT